MATRHLKGQHASAFGSGVLYVELVDGEAKRLVEEYTDKWCRTTSPKGTGHIDLDVLSPVDMSEFEAAWTRAVRAAPEVVYPSADTGTLSPCQRAWVDGTSEDRKLVTHMDLAQAYFDMGLIDDAAQEAEIALRLSANHPWAHERATQLFEQTHR